MEDRISKRMSELEERSESLQKELDAETEKNAKLDSLVEKKKDVSDLKKKLFQAKYGREVEFVKKAAKGFKNFLEKTKTKGRGGSPRRIVPKDDFANMFSMGSQKGSVFGTSDRSRSGKHSKRSKPYGFEW